MSKIKWTNDEELKLIKSISVGKSIEEIANDHNRPMSSIDLRLKKIIYENISAGRSIDKISKLLNISNEKVNEYYYVYKNFKEKTKKNDNNDIMPNKENHANTEKIKIYHENNNQVGGSKIDKLDKIELKLKKLELENRLLQLVVENKDLSHKLNKLIKEGKVDENVKKIIKASRQFK